jgi:hypothetical protein
MTYFEYMVKKIKAGYWIKEEKYENGCIAYNLRDKKKKGSYNILGIKFSKEFAVKLVKATGVRIEKAKETTVCLNHTPGIPSKDTIYILQ